MGRHDWYRNTDWNADIEMAFRAKLVRSRDKGQYIRIHASVLTQKRPRIALRLLEEYFSLGEHFDLAQAFVDQGNAYRALGEKERAFESYRRAIAREKSHPKLQTQAYLELSLMIATEKMACHYDFALELLKQHATRGKFPVDHFRWYAARALIFSDRGQIERARQAALSALSFAEQDHSDVRYHPSIGIVGEDYESVRSNMNAIIQAR
ncbi:MAG TPA: hypothetical protein VGP72_01965 [Planctomycetota bacterium]|jgi:tetratricopeptide (TPR) repeat protein